jgi:hypothetical protein
MVVNHQNSAKETHFAVQLVTQASAAKKNGREFRVQN